MILSIDPGIRGCGVALFFPNGTLDRAAYVKNKILKGNQVYECVAMAQSVFNWIEDLYGFDDCVHTRHVVLLEWPRAYLPEKQKGDQNDLLALAGVDGAIGGLFRRCQLITYKPDEWKGQLEKEVMNKRVWERLTEFERQRVEAEPASMRHNVLDAVGIGLKHLERLERNRVIP